MNPKIRPPMSDQERSQPETVTLILTREEAEHIRPLVNNVGHNCGKCHRLYMKAQAALLHTPEETTP